MFIYGYIPLVPLKSHNRKTRQLLIPHTISSNVITANGKQRFNKSFGSAAAIQNEEKKPK